MKLTKDMIRDLIKEEIEANLGEADGPKVPAGIERAIQAVLGDSGDEQYLAKIADAVEGLNPNMKTTIAQMVLGKIGLSADLSKLRAALGSAPDAEEAPPEE
jgi:hypothetical protein